MNKITLLLVLSDHLILLRNGLFDEYQEIKSQPPDGTFDNARLAQNQAKVSPRYKSRSSFKSVFDSVLTMQDLNIIQIMVMFGFGGK